MPGRTLGPVVVLLVLGSAGVAGAEDVALELELGGSQRFAAGSLIEAPEPSLTTMEVYLTGTLAEIDPQTVEFALNGSSILGHTHMGLMPMGLRLSVDRANRKHPVLALKEGDSRLRFAAKDTDKNSYRGEWILRTCAGLRELRSSPLRDAPTDVLVRYERHTPKIRIEQPVQVSYSASGSRPEARLRAEVEHTERIATLIIAIDGAEFERVQVRHGVPVRKRGRFRATQALPGTIDVNGQHLVLDLPLPVRRSSIVVRITATDRHGVEASETVPIRRPPKPRAKRRTSTG